MTLLQYKILTSCLVTVFIIAYLVYRRVTTGRWF